MNTEPGRRPRQSSLRDTMIMNTHTNAKVLTGEYKQLLAQAVINRDRVSEDQEKWLDIPPAIGTGAYDNQARGWMDNPSWDGAVQRYTPMDGPGHKGVEP